MVVEKQYTGKMRFLCLGLCEGSWMFFFLELSVTAASDITFSATLRSLSQYNESLQRGPSHRVGPVEKDWTEDFNQTILGDMFPSSLGHVTIPDTIREQYLPFL